MRPLAAAQQVGPYELVSPLGAGGMGEVWKARDTRLGRAVAIKFAQERFSGRFGREARAVAALNHPNICQLHDVGENYIVMEFVDGEPVHAVDGVRKLLDIAVQIADGLAAAHAAGFVHRDLKPDNILLTKDGRVKILDFGLAKQTVVEAADDTRAMTATDPGTVLGTVAYMSPEQARGKEVDARSDQFSFGLILYELSSGKRAFQRESAAETMTAIIRDEPAPLPAGVPAPLRWVIARLLSKEPGERYDSTRDLYRELRQVREHLSEATIGTQVASAIPARRRKRLGLVAGLIAGLAAGFLIAALWPAPPSEPPKVTPFAAEAAIQTMPAWSPQGDRIAYAADVNGLLQIFTKKLGSSIPTQMTHQSESCIRPFWSADGTRIYYLSGTRLNSSLWSVAVAGGQAEKFMDGVIAAALSPDGRTIGLMAAEYPGQYRLAFASPPGSRPQFYARPPLNEAYTTGSGSPSFGFVPSGKYLSLARGTRGGPGLWKVPLDGGAPEELSRGAGLPRGIAWLRDERRFIYDGALSGDFRLQLHDLRTGTTHPLTSGVTQDGFPALSPDGLTLAYDAGDQGYDIVEAPLDGSAMREIITTSRNEVSPAWVPDGTRFAYVTNRNEVNEIWLRNRADGSERLIAGPKDFGDGAVFLDCAVSPDGSRIAYRVQGKGGLEIWISPLSGETPVRLWEDRGSQRGPAWSPDGNWIAYYGLNDGKSAVLKAKVGANFRPELVTYTNEINPVRWSPRGDWIAFDDDRKLRIVNPDGKQDRVVSSRLWQTYGWSKDGSAIYGITLDQDRRLMLGRIDITTAKETKISDLGPAPSAAFDVAMSGGQYPFRGFSLHPDGKSFLTSIYRMKSQIYLMQGFDRPAR